MQYAFVLGRVYTLSLAELLAALPKLYTGEIKILEVSFEVLIIETSTPLDVEKMQHALGGTIKILKILDFVKKRDGDSVNFALRNYFKPSKIKTDYLKNQSGKIQFGVSIYLLDKALNEQAQGEPKRLGMFIKRAMQDSGSSIRLVLPEFTALSLASVVVTKNLLLQKGAEICVIVGVDRLYVGKTVAVQDFEDYGRRDYQRPVRDEKQGMLPPKVAQIMLNLAKVGSADVILDPFCGVATLVQEGVLLGFRMLGTDINPKAIAASEKNLEWFRNRYKVSPGRYHVEVSDALAVNHVIETLGKLGAFKKVSAIVTEGYLGPMYATYPKKPEIEANFKQLETLYRAAFEEFSKFLDKGSRVVICLPAYKHSLLGYAPMPSLDFATGFGYNLVDIIPPEVTKQFPFLKLTDRNTVIYDRKNQIIAREIVVFEKS
jgi:tRNA G10  N-methylase Trm11